MDCRNPQCPIPISQTDHNLRQLQVQSLEALQSELQQTRQELADYQANQAAQYQADCVQAGIDKKKDRRHMYICAAFSVCFTLLIEHISDVMRFAKIAFKSVLSFFHGG